MRFTLLLIAAATALKIRQPPPHHHSGSEGDHPPPELAKKLGRLVTKKMAKVSDDLQDFEDEFYGYAGEDGEVDFDEFMVAVNEGVPPEHAEWVNSPEGQDMLFGMFCDFDTNGSGTIDLDEAMAIYHMMEDEGH